MNAHHPLVESVLLPLALGLGATGLSRFIFGPERAALAAGKTPLVQLTGKVDLADDGGITLGQVWPGQLVDVDVRDHPYLPEGTYRMRLMSMAGDQGDTAQLVFDQMADPWQDHTVYR